MKVMVLYEIWSPQVNEVIGEGGFARCFSAAWETGPPAERDSVLKVKCLFQSYRNNSDLGTHNRFKCLPMTGNGTAWTRCTPGKQSFQYVSVLLISIIFRFKNMSHPLKEEAVQWQTGFMATPRCFTYRFTMLNVNPLCSLFQVIHSHEDRILVQLYHFFRDGNILVTQIQRMGTLLDLVNLTKNSDKSV